MKDDLLVTIVLLAWMLGMNFLKDLRHHLPLVPVLAAPIVFSGLITLVPDKKLERRIRIGWRAAVMVTAILYSGVLLMLITKGK